MNATSTADMMAAIHTGNFVDGLIFPDQFRIVRMQMDNAITMLRSEDTKHNMCGRQRIRTIADNMDMQVGRWQTQLANAKTAKDSKRAEMCIGRCHDMLVWIVNVAAEFDFPVA